MFLAACIQGRRQDVCLGGGGGAKCLVTAARDFAPALKKSLSTPTHFFFGLQKKIPTNYHNGGTGIIIMAMTDR